MTRRTLTETVAANITAAMKTSGVSVEHLSEATDIHLPELEKRLDAKAAFSVPELVRVGGFFRIRTSDLLEGAGA